MLKPTASRGGVDEAGFSLVELLSVMAVFATVIALVTMSLPGMMRGSSLNSTGNHLVSLVEVAQQSAISSNRPVALVIAAKPGDPTAYRLATVLQLDPERGTWIQAQSWISLAKGTIIDPDKSKLSPRKASAIVPALPKLRYADTEFDPAQDELTCEIFSPSGSLYEETAPRALRISEGTLGTGGEVQYLDQDRNFYEIIIAAATGRVRIVRP